MLRRSRRFWVSTNKPASGADKLTDDEWGKSLNPEDDFDIRQYVAALRKRLWVILTAIVVCAAAAGAASFLQSKVYSATSQVLLSSQQDIAVPGQVLNDPNQFQNQMSTQARVAESPSVEEAANKALGSSADDVISVDATGVTNTRILSITALSKKPDVAKAAADAYADAYLTDRQNSAINRVLAVGDNVNRKRQELQKQVDDLNSRIAAKPADEAKLRSDRDLVQAQINELQNRYEAAQANALVREAGAEPFSKAELPTAPISPKPVRNIALGLILGGLLGVALALVLERIDDRVRSIDDLTRWANGVPQLASIPRVPHWDDSDEAKAVTILDPQSQGAEAYRGLRTSLEFIGLDRQVKVVQVTSAMTGDGKSTTAANLATALAWSGKKVIVVGADLRRPRLHKFFGLSNDKGLTSMLVSGTPLEEALQKIEVPGGELWLLASGPLPPNPAELLSTQKMADLFRVFAEHADYVVIDSPPLLPVADPMVLSNYADGILLVAGANQLRRRQLERALEIASTSKTELFGVVLNGVTNDLTYSYKDPYATQADTAKA